MDMTVDCIEAIEEGDCDSGLDMIEKALNERRIVLGVIGKPEPPLFGNSTVPKNPSPGDEIRPGDQVKVTSHSLRPKYLFGKILPVVKVNEKTVNVNFPVDPSMRRYSGARNVRVPRSCIQKVTS